MSASARTQAKGDLPRARSEDSVALRLLEGGVIGLDLALIGFGVWGAQFAQGPTPLVLLTWIALVALAGLVPVPSRRGASLGLDLPLVLGAGLAFGPLVAGVVAFVGVLDVREIRREVSISRALFNRAQVSISAMAGASVFLAVGGRLGVWPWAAIAGLAALIVDSIVNYFFVGAYWSIKERNSLSQVLRGMRLGPIETFLPAYMCFGFLSVFVGEAYLAWGLVGVFACVAPVALARQAFLSRQLLEGADEELERAGDLVREATARIAEERREERKIIAGELHDEVLPPIFNVHLMGQVLRQDLLAGRLLELDDDIPRLVEATEVAQSSIRGTLRNLRQSTIGPGGLFPTIELFAKGLESAGAPPIELCLDGSPGSVVSQLLCFQVVREALNNVVRHADASRVRVKLVMDDRAARVTIEDDGRGFDSRAVDRSAHFGLQMLLERVEACGGKAAVDSEPGLGTRVVAVIPGDL